MKTVRLRVIARFAGFTCRCCRTRNGDDDSGHPIVLKKTESLPLGVIVVTACSAVCFFFRNDFTLFRKRDGRVDVHERLCRNLRIQLRPMKLAFGFNGLGLLLAGITRVVVGDETNKYGTGWCCYMPVSVLIIIII